MYRIEDTTLNSSSFIKGAISSTDSRYGKPNRTVHLSKVECTGYERNIEECETEQIPEEDGQELYKYIDVAGVSCLRVKPPTSSSYASTVSTTTSTTTVSTTTSTSSITTTTSTSSTIVSESSKVSASSNIPVVSPPQAIIQNQESTGMMVAFIFTMALFIVAMAVIIG